MIKDYTSLKHVLLKEKAISLGHAGDVAGFDVRASGGAEVGGLENLEALQKRLEMLIVLRQRVGGPGGEQAGGASEGYVECRNGDRVDKRVENDNVKE